MTRYIVRRLLQFIPSMIMIAFVGFLIMELPPGDYVSNYVRGQTLGGNRDARTQEAAMREQFGLDQPFLVRFADWTPDDVPRLLADAAEHDRIVMVLITQGIRSEGDLKVFLWCHVLGCTYLGWIAYTSYSGGRF